MNEQTENIGAKRLHTVLEKLLEDISFDIPEMEEEKLVIDEDLLKDEFIGVHPCLNSSTLRLKTADVVNIILPAVSHGFVTVSLPWVIEEE